jgi:hypothetical protein
MGDIGPHLSVQRACPQAAPDDWRRHDDEVPFRSSLIPRHMKFSSLASLMLFLVGCATTVARGPTSLVLVRDGTPWRIIKYHSS